MIYMNNEGLNNLHIEDKEINRVLLGEKLIWENSKVISLGTGQSFDLRQVWSKYNELTVDNIFYLSLVNASTSSSIYLSPNEGGYISAMGWLHKIYNAQTGLLETDHFASGSQMNKYDVTPVLVTDLSKIEYLGNSQSFDLKVNYPNEYPNFTDNNFIMKIDALNGYLYNGYRHADSNYPFSESLSVTHYIDKSYDASTGILTCRKRRVAVSSYEGTTTSVGPMEVYLTRRAV